ncbi:3'-5'-bisphosphate nucleotidase [Thalassospira profundimaris]|uniref:3'(2'),5'-bisphosphate nucleotidase CysQ n=1 Tax=Thalassospira profundimaris TaxID=502049 RepID=A0A367XC51_9PROT|nr:3'(2'),5'-bisphosphate nucleotidase CysQ [Thalassospira profundimaris]RCK50252.1 3'-5'-bisphosphate nucleotidase [Thalassospira profundimaris]
MPHGLPADAQALENGLIEIARRAGAAIMEIYKTEFEVRSKDDASPVTEADEAAEAIILPGLRALTPDVKIVSEESVAAGNVPDVSAETDFFWLVDPLDGTKEFIKRNGEFTVNIALIAQGVPVMGVVYAPAIEKLYFGGPDGARLIENDLEPKITDISVRDIPDAGVVVVGSRSHGDPEAMKAFLGDLKVQEMRPAGSSLKLCLVAQGEADLYPRLGRTMEWDIGAGHAVLAAAGGVVENLDGSPFVYGKDGFANPFFIARSPSVPVTYQD